MSQKTKVDLVLLKLTEDSFEAFCKKLTTLADAYADQFYTLIIKPGDCYVY